MHSFHDLLCFGLGRKTWLTAAGCAAKVARASRRCDCGYFGSLHIASTIQYTVLTDGKGVERGQRHVDRGTIINNISSAPGRGWTRPDAIMGVAGAAVIDFLRSG